MSKTNGQAPTGSSFDYALSEQNYQPQHLEEFKASAIESLSTLKTQFALTPVRRKAPFLDEWQSIDTSRDDIARYIASGNADGYGIKLGIPSGGICAIDIDGTAARCKLIDVMGNEDMPLTVEFASGKPDRSQYLFTIPPELWDSLKSKSDKIPNGEAVEEFGFFWNGRQSVLPPSAHPETGGYFWVHSPDDAPIAVIPNPLLEYWLNLITPPRAVALPKPQPLNSPKPTKNSPNVYSIPINRLLTKEHRSILSGISQGGRNNTGASLARDLIGVAAMGSIECDYRGKDYTLEIEGDAEDLFYSYCAGCSPSLSQHEGAEIWRKAQNSDREPCIRDEEILKNCTRSYLKELFPAPGRPKKQKPVIDRDYVSLGKRMGINIPAHGVDEDGIPTSKLLKLELDLLDLYGSRIEFNEMSREIELDRQPIDLNNAKEFVSRSLFYDSRTEECIIALNTIATNHKYHPVREYLTSVRGKAPKDFIKQIPLTYWKNDDELQNKLFFKKLVATVARMENPGSKDDSLLILQGKQGFGKSTGLKVLSGEDWFNDDLRSLEDKDELAKLSRFWLLELAEVDYLFGKKEIELFKRFLSATEDTFRPPYGRANIRIKRACSFFASTNKSEFLADPTGDRRYWVVEVNKNIDIEGLRRDRDLIWAAALDAYESGEKWWLEGDEMKTHAAANEVWRDDDPWGEPILSKIGLVIQHEGSIEYVRIQTIMDNILNIPLERQDKRTRNRIGATLQANGFTLKSTNIGGKKAKVWVKDIGTQENLTKKDEFQSKTDNQSEGTQENSSHLSLETLKINLINSCPELKEETKSELINNCFPEVVENWVHLSNLSSTGEESLLCAEHSRNSTRNSTQKDEFQTKKMSSREPKIGDRVRYVGQSQMHRGSIGSIVSAENNLYDCDFMGMPAKGLTRQELEVAA